MIAIGKQYIKDIECYLIEDFIESKAGEDCNVFSQYQGNSIFCSAVELARIKNQIDVPLYGIWQVLSEAGILDGLDRNKKYVIYHNHEKTAGQILHFLDENKIITQSLLVSGTDNCEEIDVTDNLLLIPQEPILTLSERMQKRRIEKRSNALQVISMIIACCLWFAFNHYYFTEEYDNEMQRLITLKDENAKLTSILTKSNEIFLSGKDYSKIMFPILNLNKIGINIKVKAMVFDKPPYHIIFPTRMYPPAVFSNYEIVEVDYKHSGEIDVYWQ